MPIRSRARGPRSPPRRRARPAPPVVASSWPCAAVTPRGRCRGRWPRNRFQVDERVVPAGDPDRNLTHLQENLLARCPLRPEQLHAMRPTVASDLVQRFLVAAAKELLGGV